MYSVFDDGAAAAVRNLRIKIHVGHRAALAIVHTGNVILKFASDAKPDAASDICKSSSIQRCDRKSTHGLGLYLCEEVKEEDFIIGTPPTSLSILSFNDIAPGRIHRRVGVRDHHDLSRQHNYFAFIHGGSFVSKHRGRSYLFQLNPTTSIDSSKAGNESRFINHDPENANCHACVRLVNGEHRIGIFALCRLKPGTELLLNYGDSFFQPDSEGSKGESKLDPKRPGASQDSVAYNLDQHSSDETYNE
ncbi:hypothetical protein D9615_006219 [Tricholomella constricta]|uniref:SET domain-containing protein n=1 Tax=Tricholomella constricta TaxID=117010 RepID=A0A8H5M4A5_9AGAR|nr:hypothetical protein D9615_006219 [Tricholomella constricta]